MAETRGSRRSRRIFFAAVSQISRSGFRIKRSSSSTQSSRDRRGAKPFLSAADATRETEELLALFDVLYPTEDVVRAALLATAAYQLPWYDAHLWAYAATNGLSEIVSEDFQHGRRYGTVRVFNPFPE